MNTVTNFMLGIRKDADGNPVVSTPEGPNTPLTQDILDRIEKNRVKVQNEALGKDTDVSNVTANTGSTGGSDDSGSDDDGGDPDPTNVIGSGYYQPNPQSDYQTDYKPSAPTGQSAI